MVEWVGDEYSVPVVPLRGYSSESFEREIRRRFRSASYRALYVGDFDSSGLDIERNAKEQIGSAFDSWQRVCLTAEQVERYQLPVAAGKATDSRAVSFLAAHGRLIQVEVEALDPDDLQEVVLDHVMDGWDTSAHRLVMERERADLAELEAKAWQRR